MNVTDRLTARSVLRVFYNVKTGQTITLSALDPSTKRWLANEAAASEMYYAVHHGKTLPAHWQVRHLEPEEQDAAFERQ